MWPERPHGGITLVVDDNPDTLRFLIDALEAAGLTALVARDGASAMALLDRVSPDAVLLDAVMPGVDGFELCRQIKARPEHAARPVLFMTGLGDAGHILEGLRAGGVDYLVKPINPDELVARVSIHIANARMIADAQSALDAAGAAIVAFRRDGAVSWTSPRARRLLEETVGPLDALPQAQKAELRAWLAAIADRPVSESAVFALAPASRPRVALAFIGRSGAGDLLTRAAPAGEADPEKRLARAFALSDREAQVLAWIARGKSNRDIATIIGLSPRTVTKHVEQIFAKLDVENRTSAAVLALRTIDADD
jgi:DNA-binding NarL/FixJ family response regulator